MFHTSHSLVHTLVQGSQFGTCWVYSGEQWGEVVGLTLLRYLTLLSGEENKQDIFSREIPEVDTKAAIKSTVATHHAVLIHHSLTQTFSHR